MFGDSYDSREHRFLLSFLRLWKNRQVTKAALHLIGADDIGDHLPDLIRVGKQVRTMRILFVAAFLAIILGILGVYTFFNSVSIPGKIGLLISGLATVAGFITCWVIPAPNRSMWWCRVQAELEKLCKTLKVSNASFLKSGHSGIVVYARVELERIAKMINKAEKQKDRLKLSSLRNEFIEKHKWLVELGLADGKSQIYFPA